MQWNELQDSAKFLAYGGERVYGVYTDNSRAGGVVYSTIGNNGACFSDYLLLNGFADDVARLNPQLIILSMGTNEGYSAKTDKQIADETRTLIRQLKQAKPGALFMLWTPQECHKKDADGNYQICDRVAEVSDIMLDVARDEGIAIWNYYDVAGGHGSSDRWLAAGLMNPRDHTHLLRDGYALQGTLAARAIIAFLDSLR